MFSFGPKPTPDQPPTGEPREPQVTSIPVTEDSGPLAEAQPAPLPTEQLATNVVSEELGKRLAEKPEEQDKATTEAKEYFESLSKEKLKLQEALLEMAVYLDEEIDTEIEALKKSQEEARKRISELEEKRKKIKELMLTLSRMREADRANELARKPIVIQTENVPEEGRTF